MVAELIDLGRRNLRDVPGKLRDLAAAIEAGEYGDVSCAAVVILADRLEVFGMGPESRAPETIAALQLGALRLLRDTEGRFG